MRRIVASLTLIAGLTASSAAEFAAATNDTAAPTPTNVATGAGQPRRGAVDLQTGVRMQYVEQGPAPDPRPGDAAAAPVVIFLHGFTDSSQSFRTLMDRLDPSIRTMAIDQRGHGGSSRPACCYAPQDFARDVVAFMDARRIPSATIVGHSMGSVVAQVVAARYPDRVGGLVLIGAGATGGTPAIEELLSVVKTLNDPIDRRFATEFQASTVFAPLPPGALDAYVDESLKVAPRVWMEALGALAAADLRPLLPHIAARTLIVWGDRDNVFSRGDQMALAQGIRHARLTVYEDIGHSVHWEAPGRVAADLETFLRGDLLLTRR